MTLKKFHHRGQVVQANTDAVALPADIASSVLDGDRSRHHATHRQAHRTAARGLPQRTPVLALLRPGRGEVQGRLQDAAAAFKGKTLPYAVCGYTGPQFRAAYEGNSDLTGTA